MKITSAGFLGLALVVAAPAHAQDDVRAFEAIARTRQTRTDFIVVSDVKVAFHGIAPAEFVGAEFHAGPFHRIEDSNFRVVGDCLQREGHMLTLATGEIASNRGIPDSLCGVGPYAPTARVRFLGTVATAFGEATRVEVDDASFNRRYDILESGALLRVVWRSKTEADRIVYESVATSYCTARLPDTAFTRDSLTRSYLGTAC